MREAAIRGRLKTKLTAEDVLEIKRLLRDNVSQSEIARRYGVTKGNIGHIARGKTWSHITLEDDDDEGLGGA
jgi:IS30 family transposase